MYHRLNNENVDDESSPDGSKDEADYLSPVPISGRYRSTSLHDETVPVPRFYIPCCGLIFYIMAFFGFFSAEIIHEGLSVAIVAMVNRTAFAEKYAVMSNVTADQCPRDPELLLGGGEFNWNRKQQGIVLAAYFYVHGLTEVPGGWLADRFGGKWLFGGCILLSSVTSLLTPAAARTHIILLIILRVLSGLGEGVMLPAIQAMIARWSVPKYRSLVVNLIIIGSGVGIVVGMLVAGVLSDYGFAGGWPSLFYVFGMFGCVWSVAWFLLCYNSPSTHPRISTVELTYWETMIGTTDLVAHPPTPWRGILTSVHVWALAVACFANSWGFITLAACLPLFMHDILGLNLTWNGALSSVPFVSGFVVMPAAGLFADWLRSPGRLSTNVVRKIFYVAGCILGSGFFILTRYAGCNRALVVASISVASVSLSLSFTTVAVNQLDLAPLHAGKIMGLTYTIGNLGSIAAPHAVNALISRHSTSSEWQNVFFLVAAVYAVGSLIFVVFGSGERQRWADDTDRTKLTVTLDRNNERINAEEVTDEQYAN